MELNAVGHNEGLLSLATLWEVLWRRRGLVMASFLALFGAVAAFVVTRPAQYDAEVKLIVKRTRTEGPVDVAKGQGGTAAGDLSEMEFASEIELFKNRRSIEEAARRCGLMDEAGEAGDEKARLAIGVQKLQGKLAIKRVDNTSLILAEYRHTDPSKAAQVLQSLTDAYLAEHLALHRNWRTSQFFDEQTGLYQQQLAQAEKSLGDFRQRHRVSMLEAEKTATLTRQNQLEGILQDAESEIHDAKDRITELRRQVGGVPETIETQSRTARNETLLERLKTRVLELEAKRTELLTKYDRNYRLVREVDQQIADTQMLLSKEQDVNVVVDRTRALNPLRQGIEAELFRTKTTLSGLEAKRANIARDYAQAQAKLQELEQITAEHNELERAVKLAEESYLMYQKRWEESRLEDAMDEEKILNVSVLEPVVPPALPVDQHKPFLMILGAIMALAGSVATGLATEYALPAIRRSIRRDEAVRPLKAVGIESEAGETASHNRRWTRGPAPAKPVEPESAGAGEAAVTVPAVIERGGAIQVLLCRELALRDEYGHVVDCIRLYQGRQEGIAVGLASNIPADEAAIAAVQLAASMYRRNGLPVLLVDAANANEPLTHFFGSPQGPGFRDLLIGPQGGENQCVHRTGFENLWILPPGFGGLNGNASPDRITWLRKALGNGTMNLVVRLPEEVNGRSWLMLYGILDGALSNLRAEDGGDEATDEIVRRVMEAKRGFDEQRLTLVGGSREWRSDSKESLTVC